MNKVIAALLTLTIFCGSFNAVFAADNHNTKSFANFNFKNTYVNNQFSDVNEAAWYGTKQQAVIKSVFELSIMNGMGNGTFCPDSNLKLSEAIKMASVVHSIYNGGSVLSNVAGKSWYQGYVDYAISNGIISANTFKNYDSYATRGQLAYIFANALPANELQQINTINSIPDVTNNTLNSSFIYTLYRAGVLTGDAETRAFRPDHKISRAEAAAIITRIALPNRRQHFEILPNHADLKSHEPQYAIYNNAKISLALGYQDKNVLNTFFHSDPINQEKYGFTDSTNIYVREYPGFGKVKYLLSDYSAGGIYLFGIYITSGDYRMKNGIHVGSTTNDLLAAYGNVLNFEGKSMFSEHDTYTYYPGDGSPWSSIQFSVENGVVSKIELNCSVY